MRHRLEPGEAPEATVPADPDPARPELEGAPHPGVTPEELAMICEEGGRPRDPSLLEPLAGPLPLDEGGEILEPLCVAMPAASAVVAPDDPAQGGGIPGAALRNAARLPVMRSFWRFGGASAAPRRTKVMDWRGPR